jgi:glycosyltransferase involved in cell wall biosynthesis
VDAQKEYLSDLGECFNKITVVNTGGVSRKHQSIYKNIVIIMYPLNLRSLVRINILHQNSLRSCVCLSYLPAASKYILLSSFLKRQSKHSYIYLADDLEFFYEKKKKNKFIHSKIANMIINHLRMAGGIIARGSMLEAYGKSLNKNTIKTTPIIYRGNLDQYRHKEKNKNFLNCITMSRLVINKGYEYIIKGLSDFQKLTGIKVCLNIVGSGPDCEIITSWCEQANIIVKLHGWISDEKEKSKIWQYSDIHIIASYETEGVPRCIDEAFLYNIPTITTKVGGISCEYSESEVIYIEAKSSKSICESLMKYTSGDIRCDPSLFKLRRNAILSLDSAGIQHGKHINHKTLLWNE